MRLRSIFTLGWIALRCAAVQADADVAYLRSRGVLLDFSIEAARADEGVRLWVSRDAGAQWIEASAERVGHSAVRYDAPADGAYGFWLALSSQPASEPPPGAPPQISVVIDTTTPTAQIHALTIVREGAVLVARLRVSVIEENLGVNGARLFTRCAGQPEWRDGGQVTIENGVIRWPYPQSTAEQEIAPGAGWDFKLVITDLAGNRGSHEHSGAAIPPLIRLAAEPAAPASQAAEAPVEVEAPASAPAFDPAAALQRDAGRRFASRGEWRLAIARYEDALRIAPDDVGTLLELATALRRERRFDDAEERLERVLRKAPDTVEALEQQALVALERRQYTLARDRLKAALLLAPDHAEHWLHLGDVDHKLGNLDEARGSWLRVAEDADLDAALRQRARVRLDAFKLTAPGP